MQFIRPALLTACAGYVSVALAMGPLPTSMTADGGEMEFGVDVVNNTTTDFMVDYSPSEAEPVVRMFELRPKSHQIFDFIQNKNFDNTIRTGFALMDGYARAVTVVIISPNVICIPYMATYTCRVEPNNGTFTKVIVGSN